MKLLLQIQYCIQPQIHGKWLFLCFFLSSSTPGALYLQGYSLVCIVAFALLTTESSHIFYCTCLFIVHVCCKQLVFELVLEVFYFVFFFPVHFYFVSSDFIFFCSPMCNSKERNCNLMFVIFTSAQSQIFANLWP